MSNTNEIKYDPTHFCPSWVTCCEENLSRKKVTTVHLSGPSKSQMLSEIGEDPMGEDPMEDSTHVTRRVTRSSKQSKSQMGYEMG
jgi:hypothetical protein